MILVVATLLLVASVPLTGGRLRHFVHLRLRALPAVWTALAAQLWITLGPAPSWWARAVHLGTYGLAAVFVVANRRVPGALVAGAGGGCNLAAIVANAGVMPATPWALEVAGIAPTAGRFANSAVVADARLWWLGDVFAVPAGVPFANVFSVGDVVLLVGLGILLHRACRLPDPEVWTVPVAPADPHTR